MHTQTFINFNKIILIYRKIYHKTQQKVTKRCRIYVVNQIEVKIEIKILQLLQTRDLFVIIFKNLILHNSSQFNDLIDYICKNNFEINLRKIEFNH